jgi:L-2-hydroxycarboxylate dehydrogenase (NAD+)
MKINIEDAKKLSLQILSKLNFPEEEKNLITKNLIEAELSERHSHGLSRLISICKFINSEKLDRTIRVGGEEMKIIKETPHSLYIDAKYKAGFFAIYKSLEKAIPKAKKNSMVTVGIKNAGYATGFIGDYAREVAENNLIFIGFHSIRGDLVPFGSKKAIFGTNPLTVGVPAFSHPVILDMASSLMTIGDVVIAKNEGKKIRENVAVDANGSLTTDPNKVLSGGGVLPMAGHKGSGLAFIIQLLAGALTGSSVGYAIPGGWGSFYILINPELFRPIKDFKNDVQEAINELKNAPKADGFTEIFYPGERSQKLRQENLKKGCIEVEDTLYYKLKEETKS